MSRIPFLLKKEFKQVFRNKAMLPLIFVMPIVQLLILVNAANFEVKQIDYVVLDHDRSQTSSRLLNKLNSTGYYRLVDNAANAVETAKLLDQRKADLILEIPANFAVDLEKDGMAKIRMELNAIDGSAASVIYYYTSSIVADFNRQIVVDWHQIPKALTSGVEISPRYWYNPELEYKNNMAPGLLVILVTMIGSFLTAMNIVREKELGTIEQLNVTPISKPEFIISKLLPFWIIGLVVFTFGLIAGKLIFDFPIEGSIPLLYAFTALYLTVVLGLGLFISTVTNTQQQAMLIAWFILVIFILMSGLFTAIENMPPWAQKLTLLNPIAYFVDFIRQVLLKGSEFKHVAKHFAIIALASVLINTLAILSYTKRS